MECIKDFKATFLDGSIAIDADYHFIGGLKIKIEASIRRTDIGTFTALEIQEAPIRLAISQLRSLLPSSEGTESQ